MPQAHVLPPLPYDYDALQPFLDERTLRLHHQGQHAASVRALNVALDDQPRLQGRSPLWLLRNLQQVPRALRAVVRHHAGGHVNHAFYWSGMAPPGGRPRPEGPLADAIGRAFGSIEGLRLEALEAWWALVNWPEAELRFVLSWKPRQGESPGMPARRRHTPHLLES